MRHVDRELETHCKQEKYSMEEVVRRVVAGVTCLGRDEHIGFKHNSNFLDIEELIGEFKP